MTVGSRIDSQIRAFFDIDLRTNPIVKRLFQITKWTHQFREVLAAGETGDGIHRVETSCLPVREESACHCFPSGEPGAD